MTMEALTLRTEDMDNLVDWIDPTQFQRHMKKLAALNHPEERNTEMDDLICKVLRQLGYGEGVEIFENTPTWYE